MVAMKKVDYKEEKLIWDSWDAHFEQVVALERWSQGQVRLYSCDKCIVTLSTCGLFSKAKNPELRVVMENYDIVCLVLTKM